MTQDHAAQPRSHPSRDSANPLTRKLSHFVPLPRPDQEVLDRLAEREERFPAHADIVAEGMAPRPAFLLKEGLAARYRLLPDGGRQIMTFLIPGDLCDYHVFPPAAMDHSVGTLAPSVLAPISRRAMMDTFARHPRISAALWWSSMQEEAMLRERIVALGRRDARGRVAYLLCELLWRHEAVGLAQGGRFGLPLTQVELGDTLGLTPVHVNKVLQEFRRRGLLTMGHKVLDVLDPDGLRAVAAFSKDYLHLGGAPDEVARHLDSLEACAAPKPDASSGRNGTTAECGKRGRLWPSATNDGLPPAWCGGHHQPGTDVRKPGQRGNAGRPCKIVEG